VFYAFSVHINHQLFIMKKHLFNIIWLFILILTTNSCGQKNRFEIDTTKDWYNVNIQRFDKDLILLDTTHFFNSFDSLRAHYPDFLPAFTENVLDANDSDTVAIRNLFLNFLADSTFTKVNKDVLKTFDNITDIETQVSDAFTYIHHYFPEVELPEIFFFVSGFNRSVILDEKFIAFGTDMYLGSDYPSYKGIAYNYMLNNMRRECIAADIVSTTLFRMFVMNSSENRLIDNMIFRGKVMYLLSVFMPNEKPEELMGYTKEQWDWSEKFEKDIWMTIIDKKDLFSTDMLLIRKYMNEAPFTTPVSQDSPGRLGTWIGWQIVDSYMNNNTNVSLQDLMNEDNSQKILEESKYKP